MIERLTMTTAARMPSSISIVWVRGYLSIQRREQIVETKIVDIELISVLISFAERLVVAHLLQTTPHKAVHPQQRRRRTNPSSRHQGHMRSQNRDQARHESGDRQTTEQSPSTKSARDQSTMPCSKEEPAEREATGGGDPIFGESEEEDTDSCAEEGGDDAGEEVEAAQGRRWRIGRWRLEIRFDAREQSGLRPDD